MSWIEIKTQTDAEALMARFGRFHDSCIREVHIWTDHWVSSELSMNCPFYLDTRIRLHLQRQFTNPMAIELQFEEVTRFNLVPAPENYCSIIFSAKLIVLDGLIHWSPDGNWTPDNADCDIDIWISARKMKWREVDQWIGEELRYGPKDGE